MSLPTKKLYFAFASLLSIVFFIGLGLYFFQKNLLPHRAHAIEIAPNTSPRQQLEFESGKLAHDLREKQMKELHPSIDEAMDEILKENSR